MRKIILFFILLLSVICLNANSRAVARIDNPSPQDLNRFLTCDADIASYKPGQYLDLVLDSAEFQELLKDYPQLHITQTEEQLKQNLQPDRDIPGYRSYTQMTSELMQIQALYPNLVQVLDIGSSWGALYSAQGFDFYNNFNHQIWAVKLTANVYEEADKPAFYFVGEHHAREPISTEACMGILIHLTENYGFDPVVTEILDSTEIWIVPLLNPDGHKIVLQQTDVWWRKNLRDNNNNHSFDNQDYGYGVDGVDLNRNYSWHWGYASGTDDFNSPVHHGPNPFSEPEVQAFKELLLSKRFLAGISYHTYGQYVLYPYGYVEGIAAPDQTEIVALANQLASFMPAEGGGFYNAMPSWQLYPTSGGSDDWIYGETGAFSYTVEMSTQFIPPASQIPQIVQQQVNAAVALLQRKDRKILTGTITDAESGEPLAATILVDGIDDQAVYRKPIVSDAQTGRYHYLLPAGSHRVHFILPGWESQSLDVLISENEPTLMDVALIPAQTVELSILTQDDFFDPLPFATVIFEDLENWVFTSDFDGYIHIPDFHPGTYRLQASKPGFENLRLQREIQGGTITLRLTEEAVFHDGFEYNLNNWVTTGSWNRTNSTSYNDSFCLTDSPNGNYQTDQNTSCRLAYPFNLQGVQNADLQFWLKRSLALDGDNLIVEASRYGTDWTVLGFYEGSAGWELQSYSLNSFLGDQLYIRFRLYTTGFSSADGVYIDDVKLFANGDVTSNNDFLNPPARLSLTAVPNPFSTSCTFFIKNEAATPSATLSIYNVRGQKVWDFTLENLAKGEHELGWDGCDNNGRKLPNGLYFTRFNGSNSSQATSKIILLK